MIGSTRITKRHLERLALVYIRQSTLTQVRENTESTARQYALAEDAARLGWERAQIVIIDADLGLSGRSASGRLGFKEIVSRVCVGSVGAIFGLEVSRLARSSADLQRLLEFCSITDTLIVDADGTYDLHNFNDRLLLGLNRPDSYRTSYSTSRGSVNLFEIFLGHQLRVAWTSGDLVAAADKPHVVQRERTTERGATALGVQPNDDRCQ